MNEINNFSHPFKYSDQSGKIKNIDKKYQNRAKIAATVGGIFTLGLAAAPILYGMSAYYRSKCRNNPDNPIADRLNPQAIISNTSDAPYTWPDSSKVLKPEDWAEMLPQVQKHLESHPEERKTWAEQLDQRFDPNVEPVAIQMPGSSQKSLPKALLISQSETLRTMFEDTPYSDEVIIEFPGKVSDQAKQLFFLGLKEGLKGKSQEIYTRDEKTAIELYQLADYYEVKWMQKELQDHLVKNISPSKIYELMDFSDFSSIDLDKFEDSPHKRLYLSCIEKIPTEGISTNEKFQNLVNLIKTKKDPHLLEHLCSSMRTEAQKLAGEIGRGEYTANDKTLISKLVTISDRISVLSDLNPDERGRGDLRNAKNFQLNSLREVINPDNILDFLKAAHQINDKSLYLAIRDLIYDNRRSLVMEPIQEYAKKNHLIDILLVSSKGLDFEGSRMSYETSGSARYRKEYEETFSKKVEIFQDVIKNNPDGKIDPPFSLRIASWTDNVNTYSLPQKNIEEITSLLLSGAFSSVNFQAMFDGHAKAVADALEKGCPELKRINITEFCPCTNEGLKAMTDQLKNSQVREFNLSPTSSVFIMDENTAASLAEAIKSNDHLENLILKCKFQNRKAFDLVYNAVVANQKLKSIDMTYVWPETKDDDFSSIMNEIHLELPDATGEEMWNAAIKKMGTQNNEKNKLASQEMKNLQSQRPGLRLF